MGKKQSEAVLRKRVEKMIKRVVSDSRNPETIADLCYNLYHYKPEWRPWEAVEKYLNLLDEFPEFYLGETNPNHPVGSTPRRSMPYAFPDIAMEYVSDRVAFGGPLDYLARIEERLRAK